MEEILQSVKAENIRLKEKLEFYERFFDSSGYWEIFRDKNGKILYLSPNFIKILGNKKDIYLKNSEDLRNFIHPEDREEVADNFKRVLSGEVVEKQISRIIKPDNSVAYVSIDYKNVYDDAGNFIGFKTCISEITDQVKAERELRLNQEYLQMIFDTMTEGVALNEIIYNENNEMVDYRILKVNKAFYNIADYNDVEVIGNIATKLYGMPEEIINKFWYEHKNRKMLVYTEMKSPLSNRTYLIATSPFYNNIFVTSFIDITERKRTENELTHYKENLEKIIMERTSELKEKNKELEHFNSLFVNREFRIKELKDKIAELESKLK
ncbi:MAG: PAS domain S-box protein [Prolixibacteraceae bacterium]|nr:PAS domain S-box protein [Prolixibacteraceae bacterium]MBN2772860.1 PAS domain S-box protein [Prolixibacteraceae bacterium]